MYMYVKEISHYDLKCFSTISLIFKRFNEEEKSFVPKKNRGDSH